MLSFLKKHKEELILVITTLLIVLISTHFTNMFGSNTDWINQHTIIPEYFRQTFYKTGSLIPNLALNYGAGENIYNFSYYGFLSPLILPSYLLPFISMTTYMTIIDILVVITSAILFYHFLKKHDFDSHISLTVSLLLVLSAPFIFQMHRHIMFVNYMPFLILSLFGVDKLLKENKKSLLIISIFLMIMTSYYYSVCGILVLGIYYLMEYFKINKNITTKKFIKDLFLFIFYILIGVLLSSILLIPTIYTLLQGRGTTESSYLLISLLTPYLRIHKIFCGTYAIGLSLIAFIALIYLFYTKKTSYIIGASCTILVLFIPIFRYLLNGGLYLREKCFIPFLPLLAYFIAIFLKDLLNNKIKLSRFIPLITIILAVLYYFNRKEYCYLIIIGFIIILLIYQKYPKKILITSYLIITSLLVCIGENLGEDYISKKEYYQIFNNETKEEITTILNTDSSFYRMNNLDNPTTTVNKIYDNRYLTTNIYSSTYNNDYLTFVREEFKNSILDYNYFLYSANKNILFNTFMGTKYLYSNTNPGMGYTKISNNIYQNNTAFPIIYTMNNLTSLSTYQNYSYPYNIELLLKSAIIDNVNDSNITTTIEPINLKYTLSSSNNVIINKNDTSYTLLVENDTGNIKLSLDKPLTNKLLFINIEGLEENTCSIDNIEMTINNVSNILTCKTWIYKNKNNTFHYLINDAYLDTLNITLKKGTYNITNISTYIMDYNILTTLKDNITPLNITSTSSDIITGNITTNEDTYLITSIPYDKGFKIYIDNIETEIIKVNTAFLGAKLPKGTHEITIKYNIPWLHTGILLSITGLIFYLIIIYKERNNNEKNKRTISKI